MMLHLLLPTRKLHPIDLLQQRRQKQQQQQNERTVQTHIRQQTVGETALLKPIIKQTIDPVKEHQPKRHHTTR